jgi:hypothetical protein
LYSLKKLFTTYTGPVITVRRSTDNQSINAYGDSSGNLTISGGASLTSWLSGATGYIVTMFDQSGKANNATQSSTSSQPTLSTNKLNMNPSKYFILPNGTIPFGNTNYTMTLKHGKTTAKNYDLHIMLDSGINSASNRNCVAGDGYFYYAAWFSNDLSFGTGMSTGNNVVTGWYNNTIGRYGYVNGIYQSSDNRVNRTSTNANNCIGGRIGASYWMNVDLYFACIFSSALSTADRLIVESI